MSELKDVLKEYVFNDTEYGVCYVGTIEGAKDWIYNTSTSLDNLRVYELGKEVRLKLSLETSDE